MNVNEMTYGVEIECYLPASAIPAGQMGGYHAGRQIAALPQGWQAQQDSSLHGAPTGYKAVEIVSPILRGEDGLRQIKLVCDWLNANHARVDRCCGFHVHVGVERNDELLRKIACLAAKHEKALYAVTGSKERERNHYCAPIQSNADFQREMRDGEGTGNISGRRYHLLNLTNVLRGYRPTVEFRVFGGSTNAVKTISYVRMCLAIVEKAHAMKRLPKWTAKAAKETSSLHHKGGEGQTALTRFFHYMVWFNCEGQHTYGKLTAEGVCTLEESRKELMRLAAKYDSRS